MGEVHNSASASESLPSLIRFLTHLDNEARPLTADYVKQAQMGERLKGWVKVTGRHRLCVTHSAGAGAGAAASYV